LPAPQINLFTLFGLKTTISPFSVLAFLAMIPLTAWMSARWLFLALGPALLAGCLSSLLMFASAWLHQWGHARAARRAGYPMLGLHFFSLFSASQYPADEPALPAAIHIRRALGGFWVNGLIGLVFAPLAFYLWPRGGVLAWLTALGAVYNFFVLGLGALVPIDLPGVFTDDGGTLLRYWRER